MCVTGREGRQSLVAPSATTKDGRGTLHPRLVSRRPTVDMKTDEKNGQPMASAVSNGKDQQSVESTEKLPYPKSIFFIIGNEFCERFSYYGMRTILVLYLSEQLLFSENQSTVIYHVFVMLCYFTPLIGGIMADSWLGKFRTILYVSLIYALGNVVLALSSINSLGDLNTQIWLAMAGLFLIGTGTGGIKPCVSSFGGDQFVVPQQEKELQRFFSVFYFSINAGSVISCFLTPMLRADVTCFNEECYPLAFGIPALLMVLSVVFFIAGSRAYKMKEPQGNIVLEVIKCSGHAIVKKVQSSKILKRDHWLDYADDLYPTKLIEDTKILMRLMVLFAPTIIFWALYEQQGSRWTFQANRMDGYVFGFIVQPDQMQTVNPVLCLIFIPIFEAFIYPVMAKLHLCRTALQKLSWGGMLAALSYVVAGLLQLRIEQADPTLPSGTNAQLRLYNSFNCPINVSSADLGISHIVESMNTYQFLDLPGGKIAQMEAQAINCSSFTGTGSGQVTLSKGDISDYLLMQNGNAVNIDELTITASSYVVKSENASAKVRVVYGGTDSFKLTLLGDDTHIFNVANHQSPQFEMSNNKWYTVQINGETVGDRIYLYPGGVYTLLVSDTKTAFELLTITTPNNLNLMWQLPQYFIITAAEIMFSITGLEFSFTQAPVSMKSVISSFWLLTDSFGNVVVLIVAGSKIVENQAYEMFLFAGMMVAVMIIFMFLAANYKYTVIKDDEIDTEVKEETSRI